MCGLPVNQQMRAYSGEDLQSFALHASAFLKHTTDRSYNSYLKRLCLLCYVCQCAWYVRAECRCASGMDAHQTCRPVGILSLNIKLDLKIGWRCTSGHSKCCFPRCCAKTSHTVYGVSVKYVLAFRQKLSTTLPRYQATHHTTKPPRGLPHHATCRS